ncbi:transcriptional regulator LysR family [Cupriavidus necator N-1]|uniref:Transcriptional regulator LysR family n=1 Tax=Cupriavidus necator (strain ATCC 43291 / DSM 13513 / CCUG 52238 / LMG 8453 / N-1) TaxID=1042878 RepID=G0EZ79_CUPNN|nr:LysR family transcriptional regulator [Cupriavidus necator]AEI77459.1 transcriptional regulator LysR family [Cupriavidus necator N-1]MDX6014001.1 LysR family transcriptional regulator [Cupriavidus necator]
MDISTRDLRAFLALIEARNFTRAASVLALSQPAFSALIAALENHVGAKLFDRSTRTITLTPEGKLFAEHAARLLAEINDAVGSVRDHASLKRGRTTVAVIPSLAGGWFPDILQSFARLHPNVSVVLRDEFSHEAIAAARDGDADFAIATPAEPMMPGMRLAHFHADRFSVICPKGHPLATRRTLKPRDLLPYPFIAAPRGSVAMARLVARIAPARLNVVHEVEHLHTMLGMVRAGVGISVAPNLALQALALRDQVAIPLDRSLTRDIYLVTREPPNFSAAAAALFDFIQDHPPDTAPRTRKC